MGQLIYAGGSNIGVPDTELAWLEAVTRLAFSAGKSFAGIIRGDIEGDIASRTLWFSPHIPVEFAYRDYETTQIDGDAFDKTFNAVIDSGLFVLGGGPPPYEFTGEQPGGSSD